MYPEIYDPPKLNGYERWKTHPVQGSFRCLWCEETVYTQVMISGVQNRNHCPYCLSSRHVDHARPGDRMSACKAIMLPIGLTVKHGRNKYGREKYGELMLIHRCSDCGKLSINRLAADDLVEKLLEIYIASFELDYLMTQQLNHNGIRLLNMEDQCLVTRQLQGIASL